MLFTGETVHPWHFGRRPRAASPARGRRTARRAHRLAPLYDPVRLAANQVPVAAAVYHDDMYVDTQHSLHTARTIRGLCTWVTGEYEHDGVRASGPRVIDRLLRLARGEL
jgi:hypothetical protein